VPVFTFCDAFHQLGCFFPASPFQSPLLQTCIQLELKGLGAGALFAKNYGKQLKITKNKAVFG